MLGEGGTDLIFFSITIYSYKKKVQAKRTLQILYISLICCLKELVRTALVSRW